MNLNNSIGWCDATWNPYTGCKNTCGFCYARRLAEGRLKGRFGYENGFEPTFHPDRLQEPYKRKTPTKIFVSSMGDLFGDWMMPDKGEFGTSCIDKILQVVAENQQHTFQFLTKYPQNIGTLMPWFATPFGKQPFILPNMWVGTSVTCEDDLWRIDRLRKSVSPLVFGGKLFVSFEPLLSEIRNPDLSDIDWVIIGAQTGHHRVVPASGWVSHLTQWAKEDGIPVFQKNNLLKQCLPAHLPLVQEFPVMLKQNVIEYIPTNDRGISSSCDGCGTDLTLLPKAYQVETAHGFCHCCEKCFVAWEKNK